MTDRIKKGSMERNNIPGARMDQLPAERFCPEDIHHSGKIDFHRTPGNTRMAGEAEPNRITAYYCTIRICVPELKQMKKDTGGIIHFTIRRTSGRTFTALITPLYRYSRFLSNKSGKRIRADALIQRHTYSSFFVANGITGG